MISRIFMSLLAILFPWLVLALEDNPGGAVVALVMQASVFGWPFAAVWALRTLREARKLKVEERRQDAEEKRKAKQQEAPKKTEQ